MNNIFWTALFILGILVLARKPKKRGPKRRWSGIGDTFVESTKKGKK